jgi:hypothetical protein
MQHFANFNAPASLAEREGREVCGFHFADFALTPEQLQTKQSMNYLRQNDPEEFQKVKADGKVVGAKNRQNIQNKLDSSRRTALNADPNLSMQDATAQSEQLRAGIAKKNQQAYNQKFVKSTNANQASDFVGQAKNTTKRWGAKAAGIGGGLMTAAYVLPMLGGLMPAKQQQEEERY